MKVAHKRLNIGAVLQTGGYIGGKFTIHAVSATTHFAINPVLSVCRLYFWNIYKKQ
jgi:hypothetical protein